MEIVRQPKVVISAQDIAIEFARADSKSQAIFLQQIASCINYTMPGAKWIFQCRAITDDEEWDEYHRAYLINQLETLLDHLKDPQKKEEQ